MKKRHIPLADELRDFEHRFAAEAVQVVLAFLIAIATLLTIGLVLWFA